jgi:N-methylhydantoinase A/oxoprolinase/acetone carboxylase beta subunit
MSLPEILDRIGLTHPIQFDGQTFIKEDIIGRAALTPTDLLHLTGEFAPWDAEAANIAASLIARLSTWSVDQLIQRVKTHIAERIVAEVVSFTSGQTFQRMREHIRFDNLGLWLFEESLCKRHPYLGCQISLRIPIIGIGAPAGVFLPRVAELLQTELILPQHYQVANAVGAVAGSVMVCQEVWILPQTRGPDVIGYYAQAGQEQRQFPKLAEAITFVRQAIGEQALSEAKAAGAVDPDLEFEQSHDGAGCHRLRAWAIGTPGLSEPTE